MSLLTYFKATLRCPYCAQPGPAWIQSKLGSRGATYEVGDCPGKDIPPVDFEDTSFLVRKPAEGEPVRLLASWTCEACGRASFAEVVFADGCVRSIEATELTPATLSRIHYIAESDEDMLQTIMGEPPVGDPADWLPKLETALESGRRW